MGQGMRSITSVLFDMDYLLHHGETQDRSSTPGSDAGIHWPPVWLDAELLHSYWPNLSGQQTVYKSKQPVCVTSSVAHSRALKFTSSVIGMLLNRIRVSWPWIDTTPPSPACWKKPWSHTGSGCLSEQQSGLVWKHPGQRAPAGPWPVPGTHAVPEKEAGVSRITEEKWIFKWGS